jgi:hypothetical protein
MIMKARENPFTSDRIENLAFRFPGTQTWDTLLARLEANQFRGSIVGPHGSGKSTVMEQLVPRLEERGFVPHLMILNAESKAANKDAVLAEVRRLRAPDFLLLDGAEQMSTRQWLPLRAVVDQLAGCVVSVHRTGRLPTVLETETSPALLEDIVAELTGSRLPAGEAAAIHLRNRGDIRSCLRELYDRWAG